MNSVVVLLMLLLAVPLQLFLSHYISTAYAVTTSSGADSAKAGTDGVTGDIHSFRAEAMHRQVATKRYCFLLQFLFPG